MNIGGISMKSLTRPAWMEINLDNLIHNYKEIRGILNNTTELMAVVKADAYEHGAIEVVKTLIEQGVKRFGVANLSEALHIRKYVDDAEILIMGYTPDYLMEPAVEKNITITIYREDQAKMVSEIAGRLGKTGKIHLKIDTGMNRLGFIPDEVTIKIIEKIYKMDNIEIEGIFTHFAVSDYDISYTMKQAEKFDNVIKQLENIGIDIPIKHANNSAGIMNFREFDYNMVRAGVILYGIYPYNDADRNLLKLRSVAQLKAQVSNVKEIEKGEKLSYGLIYEASGKTKVATVPVGYADGYSRQLSNKGSCLIKNEIVPIIGRICMDQLMIDVTDLDVKIGDEVILIGKSGDKEITLKDIAEELGDIPASVVSMINKRFPRVYFRDNEILKVTDYLLEI